MKVAILSDVHGNEAALEAVLADIERVGVDDCYCLGDLLGLGPRPNQVLRRVRSEGIETILGNHEVEVLAHVVGKKSRKAHIAWTAKVLKKRHRKWLRSLPPRLAIEAEGHRILLLHGSPRSLFDFVFPSLTATTVEGWFPEPEDRPDVLVAGHTHLPFVKRVGGVLVVNAGSAGKPIDGDPRVSWALLEVDEERTKARIRRVKYDVEETLAAHRKSGLPGRLRMALEQSVRRWPPRDIGGAA